MLAKFPHVAPMAALLIYAATACVDPPADNGLPDGERIAVDATDLTTRDTTPDLATDLARDLATRDGTDLTTRDANPDAADDPDTSLAFDAQADADASDSRVDLDVDGNSDASVDPDFNGDTDSMGDTDSSADFDVSTDVDSSADLDLTADLSLDFRLDTLDDPATPDATTDTALDAISDTTPDATPDAAPDANFDATPDANFDAFLDTTPDATTDAASPDAAIDAFDAGAPDFPPAPASELLAPPYLMWGTETGVSIRWETSGSVEGRVDYGTSTHLGRVAMEGTSRTTHEIRLEGLSPDTVYHYRISWNGRALPVYSFRTAPPADSETPFDFVVFADNQNGPDNFAELIPLMVDEAPSFALSAGDCVQNGTRREYRDQLFEPISPLARSVPFLVGAGNHERYSDSGAELFDEYMSQPGDEHCFGWRWGSLYVMFIDTELSIDVGSPQYGCIVDGLSSDEATSATYRAAIFHKPPRIEWWVGGVIAFTENMEAPWVREDLEPLLESLDVDLVFNGHNHLYAYTPETEGGVTWVTSGGAGGTLDTRGLWDAWRVGTWPEIETTIHEHHFLSVSVTPGAMTVTAIDPDGVVLHTFTVTP